MTSKNSLTKMIGDDLRQRMWLVVLSSLLFILALPATAVMHLENKLGWIKDGIYTQEALKEWYLEYLTFGNGWVMMAVIILAIIAAFSGFFYLYASEKVDYYHSMPVKRSQLYLKTYLSGLLAVLIPYVICQAAMLVIGSIKGVGIEAPVLLFFKTMILPVCYYLLVYHFSILAVVLTGRVITGVFATMVFLGYGTIVSNIFGMFGKIFLSTYTRNQYAFAHHMMFSPVGSGLCMSMDDGAFYEIIWKHMGLIVFVIIALGAAAFGFYLKRPSEGTKKALAFPKMSEGIKVMLSVSGALLLSGYIASYSEVLIRWCVLYALVTVVVLCLIIEFIYHTDMKRILRGKIAIVVSAVLTAGIIIIYQYDVFGYDSMLPKEGKIKSMSFIEDSTYPYYWEVEENKILDMKMEEFGAIYELAKEGVENARQNRGRWNSALEATMAQEGKTSVIVEYAMKNGAKKNRRYFVEQKDLEACMETLWKDVNWRKVFLGIGDWEDDEVIRWMHVNDICTEYGSQSIEFAKDNSDYARKIKEAYEKDVEKSTFDTWKNAYPQAEMTLAVAMPNANGINEVIQNKTVFIYEDFTNTKAVLEELGCPVHEKIDANEVAQLYIKDLKREETENTQGERSELEKEDEWSNVTDLDEMQKILDALTFRSRNIESKFEEKQDMMEVRIWMKNGKQFQYSIYGEKLEGLRRS